jgi:hypothetical protein
MPHLMPVYTDVPDGIFESIKCEGMYRLLSGRENCVGQFMKVQIWHVWEEAAKRPYL